MGKLQDRLPGDEETKTALSAHEDTDQEIRTAEISTLLAEAHSLQAEEPKGALAAAEKALVLAEGPPSTQLARCVLEVGLCHRWLTNYDQALLYFHRALVLSRACPEPAVEAHCLAETALISGYRGDYPALIENALLALSIERSLGNTDRSGKMLQYIGIGYSEFGDFAAALPYYLEALQGAEQAGNVCDVSFALCNIAGLYRHLGDVETGRDFSEKCLQAARQSATPINEAVALCQISEYFSGRKEYQRALEISQEALDVANRIRLTQPTAALNAWQVQGQAYLGLGNCSDAIQCFQNALDNARSCQDSRHEAIFLQKLAAAYRQQGRRDKARTALEGALKRAEDTQARQHIFTAHRDLGTLDKEEGDLAGALAHAEAYHAVEREVLTIEADNRAKALAVRMQVEQAKQEALAHLQDAQLHRLRNVELAETLQALAEVNGALEQANSALEQANQTLLEQADLLKVQTEELQAQASELQAQADELERQAATDGLTGLYNRRFLAETLVRYFSEAQHSKVPLTVAMIDIDYFKSINDRFGHQVGDEVLMTVARLFQRACRTGDLVARYGGEEFALVLPETGMKAGVKICERLHQEVQDHDWAAIHLDLAVTVSVGLSADLSVPSYERLLGLADKHLYEAKHSGRNRVYTGDPFPSQASVPTAC